MIPDRWAAGYLAPGERILWEGRPAVHACALKKEEGKSLLFLPPLASAVGMVVILCTCGAPWWAAAGFGTLMGFLALTILFDMTAPALYRRRVLHRTAYAITNRRILRYRGGVTDALDSRSRPAYRLIPHDDGTSTISFSTEQKTRWTLSAGGVSVQTRIPQTELTALLTASLGSLDSIELTALPDAEAAKKALSAMDTLIPPASPLPDPPLLRLEPGERLLWQGRPEKPPRGWNVNWLDFPGALWAMLIGLAGWGLMLYALVTGPDPGPALPVVLAMFGLPFAFGAYRVCLRSCILRQRMAQTAYVITDRRVLAGVRGKTRQYVLRPGDVIGMTQGRGGCGTIVIGSIGAALQLAGQRRKGSLCDEPGFQLLHIPQPLCAMDALHALLSTNEEESPC